MAVDIILGDCLDKMKGLLGNSVDSVVTDPPAGISFMGRDWDSDKGGRDNWIAWLTSVFNEVIRILKPGGHMFVWALPRTSHWTALAIENAGFEVRDCVYHVFGSGFPKSMDISKAIDKNACLSHFIKEHGRHPSNDEFEEAWKGFRNVIGVLPSSRTKPSDSGFMMAQKLDLDPTTLEAKQWEGWGTALKPAVECWWLARKPISEKSIAENVLKWGTGAINIDGSRVPLNGEPNPTGSAKRVYKNNQYTDAKIYGDNTTTSNKGRFPANFIHDGSQQVLDLFPNRKGMSVREEWIRGDSGSAARFFYCAKASKSERDAGIVGSFINMEVCICYSGNGCQEKSLIHEERLAMLRVDTESYQIKVIEEFGQRKKNVLEWNTMSFGNKLMVEFQRDIASTTKTETQLTTISKILHWLMLYLTKEYTLDANSLMVSGGNLAENAEQSKVLTTIINDAMALALGANSVVSGMQLKIKLNEEKKRSDHPTVKPISLMRYLCRLITPPGGTILDPFLGSGSTGISAQLDGFGFIGIEQDDGYFKIAEARIGYWKEHPEGPVHHRPEPEDDVEEIRSKNRTLMDFEEDGR